MKFGKITILLFLLALAVRSVGLLRTAEGGASFHPDVAKQVQATHRYLKGIYLWYTGSLAYDGYPFGLNHVDEGIIRATWPVLRAGQQFVHPGAEWPRLPDLTTVHTYCRVLRVAYGMLAWLLLAWALRRVGVPPGWRAAWLLLGALAPLLSTVTHLASGDVGTDLFVMLALALLARARGAKPRPADFLLCGVALGMAFACKYQGVLGILAPALFLLLAPIAWSTRIRLGLRLAGGSLIGFALLTPHVFIDPGVTLKNIALNFRYIQRYGVDRAFFERPLGERLALCLHNNLPIAAEALGYGLVALAGLALLMALARLVRQRTREHAWDAAVILMPFAVLALAVVGKPALQPFHFSLLPLPLLLGAASIWRQPAGQIRWLLAVLLLFTAGECALRQRYEWRFWSREEPRLVAARMQEGLLHPAPGRMRTVARLVVEPPNMAVFRNARGAVRLANAKDWLAAPQEAVPATPWPFSTDWVFLHLPTFPRESRLLVVEPNHAVRRLVLDQAGGKTWKATLMAGSREAEVTWTINGQTGRQFLTPGQRSTLTLDSARGIAFARDDVERVRHTVSFQTRGAPVVVRLGPEPVPTTDPARLARKLAHARLLEGKAVLRDDNQALLEDAVLLPGRYALDLHAPADAPALTLSVDDALLPHAAHRITLAMHWTQNVWRAEWDHPASFLFTDIRLQAASGGGPARAWQLRPVNMLPPEPVAPAAPAWQPQVAFGGSRWVLGNLHVPATLRRDEPLILWPRLQAEPDSRERLDDYSAFIHVFDEQGQQVRALDLPLSGVPSHLDGASLPYTIALADLAPGRYEVQLGMYQPRIVRRLDPQPLTGLRRQGQRVVLGQFTLQP